jgi:DNA-binding transcriptional LysR family regulator
MLHLNSKGNIAKADFKSYFLYCMDTRFLESFVTVVEQGSIAEAARRLNLTGAAIAQRIHALESEIGAPLVSRSGRTVRPTEAGVAILGRARNLLKEVRDLGSVATDDKPAGELRLGAISSAISGVLPGVLTLLTVRHPAIEVYILPGTSEELYHKILDGDLDAAIITRPPFSIPKACEWRTFREEPLIVLVPAAKSDCDPHAILASEPFIRYERSRWGGRLVDGYLRHARIWPRERYELHALDAIAVLVDRGLGVSLVPDWAPPWPEGLSLAKLPLPEHSFARRIGLLWTRASVRLRLVRAFLDEASTALALAPKGRTKRKHSRARSR